MATNLTANSVPVFDLDPFSPELLRQPYDYHRAVRALGPIVHIAHHDFYALPNYTEARAVLEDWNTFTTTSGAGLSNIRKPGAWRPASPIVEVDPPEHTGVRSVLNRILSPAVVRSWGERFKLEGEKLIERVVAQKTFDAVAEVAEAFVYDIFPKVLGVQINRDQAVAVGDLNFNAIGPKNAYFEASMAQVEPLLPWWQKTMQRESMIPGGFGERIFQAEEAGELMPGTSSGLIMSFLRGGMDTTVSAIGSSIWLFATNKDQWELLRREPNRVRAAFDETIRIESPVQTLFRTTTRKTELAGFSIEADTKIGILFGAANRDPSHWDQPDRFDILRRPGGHLALGYGIHSCIGQMVARLEFESVLAPLVKRAARIDLAGDEPPAHRPNNILRTLQRLPVRIIAG